MNAAKVMIIVMFPLLQESVLFLVRVARFEFHSGP